MYGPKYVEKYRDEIRAMYEEGNAEKSEKKSPGQMLEILSSRYPEEFCLPGENDIRTEISKYQAQKKKNTTRSSGTQKTTTASASTVPAIPASTDAGKDLKTYLVQLLTSDPLMKPASVLAHVKAAFGQQQLPNDQQIKSKFSALKAKAKKS